MIADDLRTPGFDRRSFWREANSMLLAGTGEMLRSVRDKEALLDSFDRMDTAVADLVARTDAPEDVRKELDEKMRQRIAIFWKDAKKMGGFDRAMFQPEKRKAAAIILGSIEFTRGTVVDLDRIIEEAAAAMCTGNLTYTKALALIDEFAGFRCKSLGDMLWTINQDNPTHMDFVSFIQKNGTAKARSEASRAISMMAPEGKPVKAVVLARVIELPRKPLLRHF
jgi:hypothetical protein